MKKYYFIFFILCFIIAILFSIHFFSYLISKELSFNFIDFFRINYWKYIFGCGGLITLYTLLGYYYFTKFKADKPSYSTIKKLQIFCFKVWRKLFSRCRQSHFLLRVISDNLFHVSCLDSSDLLANFGSPWLIYTIRCLDLLIPCQCQAFPYPLSLLIG